MAGLSKKRAETLSMTSLAFTVSQPLLGLYDLLD
jgi:hypothetical protein